MIKVVFHYRNGRISGYEINGHATFDEDDDLGRLICASVSSAAIMAANTVTEIIGDNADVAVDEGSLKLICADETRCADILEGARLHFIALSQEYPDRFDFSDLPQQQEE